MDMRKGFLNGLALAVVCFAALGLATVPAWAQTTVNANWIDSTGNWTNASNWSCNCIPNNTSASLFNVTIPSGDVSLDEASSLTSVGINTLSAGATLEIHDPESLNITGDVNLASGGSLTDDAANSGTLPGAVTVGGNVTNNGGVVLGSAGFSESAIVMAVAGSFMDTRSSGLILQPFSTLQASSFTNSGQVHNFGGTITISGDLTNGTTGNILAEGVPPPTEHGVALNVGGNLANSGTVSVSGGLHEGTNTVAVGGSLTNAATGDLEIDETTTVTVTGATRNSGTITLFEGTPLYDLNAASLSTSDFRNSGTVTLLGLYLSKAYGASGSLTVDAGGAYTQTAGLTDVDGTLMAPAVRITGGTLSGGGNINGSVISDATVLPGALDFAPPPTVYTPATLTIHGNYTQNADGTLLIDIASTGDFSILDVTGKASLDGTADFDFLNGYVPGANTDLAFLQAAGVAGDFTSLEFTNLYCPTCTFNLSTLSLDTGSTPPTFGNQTPKPSSLVLFGTALVGLAALLRRRQRLVVRD